MRLNLPKPKTPPRPDPAETPADAPTMQLAWSLDLATAEQRKNAGELLWGIMPPSIHRLHPLGDEWLLADTSQHLQLRDAVTGAVIRDLGEGIADTRERYDSLLVADAGFYVRRGTAVQALPDGDVVNEWKQQGRAASKAITPDGRLLLVLTYDGVLYVNEVQSGRERFTLEHARPKNAEGSSCVVSPDGLRAASSWKGSICFGISKLRLGEQVIHAGRLGMRVVRTDVSL